MSGTSTAIAAPTYPQYWIGLRWTQDGEHDPKYPRQHEGLPEGRMWNGTSLNRMYREEQADLESWVREDWWPRYVAEKRAVLTEEKLSDRNPELVSVEVKFVGREAWCLSWFEHWTFDVGQSDAEALASFESYVRRHEWYQEWSLESQDRTRLEADLAEQGIGRAICLMGADDRWRWKGDGDGKPPCRCKHCREQGVIRIGH
jgi:hypothetical protein